MLRGAARATVLLAGLLPAACSGSGGVKPEDVQEVAVNVLTLQRGTMSDLRAQRGRGPFRTYDVPPDRMLVAVEAAVRRAHGRDGRPVAAVFTSPDRGEVVAKERAGEDADDTGYGAPFRSAVLVVVHPVPGDPGRSRVEIHSVQRGPFHGGVVRWEADLPRWIDEALAADRPAPAAASGIRRIP